MAILDPNAGQSLTYDESTGEYYNQDNSIDPNQLTNQIASNIQRTSNLVDQKRAILGQRAKQKQQVIGPYNKSVVKDVVDGDTIRVGDEKLYGQPYPNPRYGKYPNEPEFIYPNADRLQGYDAYEVYKNDPRVQAYYQTPSGQKKLAEQRQRLSGELGVPADQVTNEMIFARGAQQKAELAAKLYGEPDADLGTLDDWMYYGSNKLPMNDLNIPVERATSGQGYFGRPLSHVKSPGSIESINQQFGATTQPQQQQQQNLSFLDKLYGPTAETEDGQSTTDYDGRGGELIDAAQYSIGSPAAQFGDWIADTGIRAGKEFAKWKEGKTEEEVNAELYNRLPDYAKKYVDEDGNFIGLDKYKTKEEYGYQGARTEQASKNLAKAWESGDTGDMLYSLGEGVINAGPEWLAESLGYMMSTGNPITMSAVILGQGNEWIEDYEKQTGEKASNERKTALMAGSAGAMLLEKLGVDALIGNSKFLNDLVGFVSKSGSKEASLSVARKLAGEAAKFTGKSGYEGLTESAQEAVESYVKKYGTEQEKELYDGTLSQDAFVAFGSGVGAGGTATGTAQGVSGIYNTTDKGLEKVADVRQGESKARVKDISKDVTDKQYEDFVNRIKTDSEVKKLSSEEVLDLFISEVNPELDLEQETSQTKAKLRQFYKDKINQTARNLEDVAEQTETPVEAQETAETTQTSTEDKKASEEQVLNQEEEIDEDLEKEIDDFTEKQLNKMVEDGRITEDQKSQVREPLRASIRKRTLAAGFQEDYQDQLNKNYKDSGLRVETDFKTKTSQKETRFDPARISDDMLADIASGAFDSQQIQNVLNTETDTRLTSRLAKKFGFVSDSRDNIRKIFNDITDKFKKSESAQKKFKELFTNDKDNVNVDGKLARMLAIGSSVIESSMTSEFDVREKEGFVSDAKKVLFLMPKNLMQEFLKLINKLVKNI